MSRSTRYVVTVGNRPPLAVDIAFDQAHGMWAADADGSRVLIRVDQAREDGLVALTVDGEPLQLRVLPGDDGHAHLAPVPSDGGVRVPVRVRSAGEIVLSADTGARELPEAEPVLRAPITGVILEVLVSEGQVVAEGAALVVLEAMKMETVLRAPRAGRVSTVHVVPGDRVRTSTALVEVAVGESRVERAHLH